MKRRASSSSSSRAVVPPPIAALSGGASRHAVYHAVLVVAAVRGEACQRRILLRCPRQHGPNAEDAPHTADDDLMRRRLLTLAAADGENVEAEAISKQPGFSIARLRHRGRSMSGVHKHRLHGCR
jgi:hypothetical protein